ncbi:ATP-binding protein [Verticiella alkaliphila]|uniref:ATP-binding protein n=1 Tax=Verticiella alkaliphila TaxID=2779529 RepID=UPI00209BA767|nr:ATP-binding protein [Verticiella sp. GG226]
MPVSVVPAERYADIFVGDGEMSRLMRTHDWASTPLGLPDTWPSSLKAALRVLLTSRFQMWLGWGDGVHFFYNDAYRPTLGNKHPRALGMPTQELWAEIWDDVSGHIDRVYRLGESTWDDALLLMLQRHGYAEETYHTFSYSPLVDDEDRVNGLFCAVSEETNRVISERRLRTVRELAVRIATADTREALLGHVSTTLHEADRDLPFSLLYLNDEMGVAQLVFASGIEAGHPLAPPRVVYGQATPWSLADTATTLLQPQLLDASVPAPRGPWRDVVRHVAVAPLSAPSAARPIGFLVVGMNPHRLPDDDYLGFIRLLSGQVGGALDRIQALEASRAERDRLRNLFHQAPGFMCVLRGPNHVYELVNNAYEELVGRSGIEGLSVIDVVPSHGNEALLASLANAYRSGEPFVGESVQVMLRRPERSQPVSRYLDFIFQPIHDDAGAVTGVFVDGYDVTDKVLAERALRQANEGLETRIAERTQDLEAALERLRAEVAEREAIEATLRQSQKMEAVGQLTGGIAHDFNNLLAALTGSLELMQRRLQQGRHSEIGHYIGISQSAAKRAAALTHRLLAFSRRQTLEPRPTDVNRLVSGMEDLVRRSIGPHITLEVVGAVGLWSTLVDPNQLENALLNLCINASDAMPQGGRLTIETANRWMDERTARERMLAPGQYISLSVTDTGTGMPSTVMNRIFEPFFTTKPLGTGTGLGLSMVYGFAQQSGGQVRVYSEVGMGSTLSIYLPRDYGTPTPQLEVAPADEAAWAEGDLQVLLVDDESSVRALASESLADLGYKVLLAHDGATGLSWLQSRERIDLLITDVGLPGGMNGRQLADAALALRPDLKVLFITGYAENAVLGQHGLLQPGMRVLTKPFTLASLTQRVRDLTRSAVPQPSSQP